MSPTHQPTLQLLYNDARLSSLFDALDALHSAASDGSLRTVTTLSNAEMIAWLRDLIYTAQETIEEIQDNNVAAAFEGLSLVRKTS
ncbi:MAG: hypothetical protein L6Q98_17510 [Anaerolineae bacterium]|nr:hypothetical protein [Anaerolineae bacterium]NUQ05246.1 hypothetical protein [Anaerolineae bacterium]